MAFRYQYGGVEIASDIALPGLRLAGEPRPGAPWIYVREGEGEAPAEEKLHFAWDGRFRMRLGEGGGEWLIGSPWGSFVFDADATNLRIFGASGPAAAIVRDLFVRRVLPRLVKLKGAAVYHAASIARGGRGVMVMGRSGAGKSTMTLGLSMHHGWDLYGDDMAMLWHDAAERTDRIAPAAMDVTIWPHAAAGLGIAARDCVPLPGHDGKCAFHPQCLAPSDPVPLAGIFFVERTARERPELTRYSRAEAFAMGIKQFIYFNPGGEAKERLESVTRLNDMLGRVPVWKLAYPASFDALPSVSDTMWSALEQG